MALTSGSSEMSIRKFDGTNFNFWKEQMQDYLIVRGLIDPIEHNTAPASYKPELWTKLDRVVRTTIWRHLSESVYYTVQSCTIGKELSKTLSDTYENKVVATKIYFIRRLHNLLRDKLSIGRIGWTSCGPDRFGPTG
jgi:hypothetical protein